MQDLGATEQNQQMQELRAVIFLDKALRLLFQAATISTQGDIHIVRYDGFKHFMSDLAAVDTLDETYYNHIPVNSKVWKATYHFGCTWLEENAFMTW